MTFLIWKSLLHRKLQALSIIIAIAISIAIIFCITALYKGIHSGMEISRQRMGADIVIIPGGLTIEPSLYLFGGAIANTYMPKDTLDAVRSIPGVTTATPQFFTNTLTADCHDIGTNNRMLGYDPASDWIVGPWLKKIHKNELSADEVILGAKIPTWVENKIAILGKWYNIVAIAEETGTSLDYSLFVSMDEARRVVSTNKQLKTVWEKQGPPAGLISAVLVKVSDTANVNEIVSTIQQVGYVQTIVAAEVKKRINDQFTVLVLLLGGVGALTALSSLFQLFSRFYTLTWDRQAEWGLYLAIGASGRDITFLIVGEAIAITLTGAITGLVLGAALYQTGLAVLAVYQSFPYIAPSWLFLTLLSLILTGVYILLGALAAWLPSYRGRQIDPSTTMTRGEFD
jgi:putative ABC transport system permease protein